MRQVLISTKGKNKVLPNKMRQVLIFAIKNPGLEVFSQSLAELLSSPLIRFTSLFGMGRGGTVSLQRPGNFSKYTAALRASIILFEYYIISTEARKAKAD